MSVKRFASALAALCVAGSATTALADSEYGRSGPYIAGGGTYAIEQFDPSGVDNAWGYDLKAGYRFNPYFSLEAEWQHMLGFDSSADDTDFWMVGLNAKGYILPGPVQPYVLAGFGWAGGDVFQPAQLQPVKPAGYESESDWGARFAGGIDFYLSRNFVIYAEGGYVMGIDSLNDLAAVPITLGIQWRFF